MLNYSHKTCCMNTNSFTRTFIHFPGCHFFLTCLPNVSNFLPFLPYLDPLTKLQSFCSTTLHTSHNIRAQSVFLLSNVSPSDLEFHLLLPIYGPFFFSGHVIIFPQCSQIYEQQSNQQLSFHDKSSQFLFFNDSEKTK